MRIIPENNSVNLGRAYLKLMFNYKVKSKAALYISWKHN